MSVNQVLLVGHLGRDPEVRSFNNGGKIANLSVGTSISWKDRNTGEKREKTEWHRVSVKSDFLADMCAERLKKGSKVTILGMLETRKWQDQSGADRYSTDVVVAGFQGTIEFPGGHRGGGDPGPDDQGGGYGGSGQGGGARDLDDEIPF